jgi:hypothetical protein
MTKYTRTSNTTEEASEETPPASTADRLSRLWWFLGGAAVAAVVFLGTIALTDDDAPPGQRSDVDGQGGDGQALEADGASLIRGADGLAVEIVVPTPEPGSYEYPIADMVPDGAAPHPEVTPGGEDAPEAFTAWMFVFNHPDECTDGSCDTDDLGADTAALGGVYQVDGRVAEGEKLTLTGRIRLGQVPASFATLENPIGAEVHVAIAPHGMALPGADGLRQLNGPIGNPTLWWAATFLP